MINCYIRGFFSSLTFLIVVCNVVSAQSSTIVQSPNGNIEARFYSYQSPFQMVSDHPSAYQDEPSFQFIKNALTTWDKTQVLDGVPGEYITIARKKETQWFLGAMANEDKRDLEISLSFLGKGNYTAVVYKDAPEPGQQPKQIIMEERQVNAKNDLKIHLASAGRPAIRFIQNS